jgi:hypothetical protein
MFEKTICLLLVLLYCTCLTAKPDGILFDLKVVDGKITASPAKVMNKKVEVDEKQCAIKLNSGNEKNQLLRVYSKAIRNNGTPLPRSFTVEAWFKANDMLKAQQLVHKLVWWSKSGYNDGAFSVGIQGGKAYVAIWTIDKKLRKGRKLTVCRGGTLVPGNWNFIAAVFDGRKLQLFVNGKKCTEKNIPDGRFPYSSADKQGTFIIGGGCYTGRSSFSGLIGRIRVRGGASEDFFFKESDKVKIESALKSLKTNKAAFDCDGLICYMDLRPGGYTTDIANAIIVAPDDTESFALGTKLSKKLGIPCVKGTEVVIERCKGLKPEYLDRNLILLGNVNNNEAIIPLYAKFLSWADAAYPGNGGCALRTIRNPYGTLKNNILIAASDFAGLQKGVDKFLEMPELKLAQKKCDYVFYLKPVLDSKVKNELRRLEASVPRFIKGGASDLRGQTIGKMAVGYYLSGNPELKKALTAFVRNSTEKISPLLKCGHYDWENYVRTVEIVSNCNLVSEETVRRFYINLFLGIYKHRKDFGIRRYNSRVGGRHQLPPTCAYMMLCDHMMRNLGQNTSANIRNFVKTNFDATSGYFKNLSKITFSGADDSSSTATNMTSILQAAFYLGDMTVFENKLALEGAKKMICITDNWGYGIGAGTYEDAYEDGMTKKPYINGGPLCYTAFYYRKPDLKWIKANVKGMNFSSWFARTWFGLHKYATGNYLPAKQNTGKYMTTFCRPRPYTLDNYVSIPGFKKEDLFDKAVIRTGAAVSDAYIGFQGNGSAKEGSWNSASDTLVLLRYADKGVLWLANNTQLNGAAWRNSFMVSNGSTLSNGGYPFARLNFLGKVNGCETFSASVRGVRDGVWTRRAVYLGNGKLFVADTFEAGKDGEYSFLQTFKTPVPAKKNGKKVIALKSGWRMIAAGTGKCSLSIDNGIRRMEPQMFWYFRRSYNRKLKKNEKVTIATIFDIAQIGSPRKVDLVEASPERFYVYCGNKWAEINLNSGNMHIRKNAVYPVSAKLSRESNLKSFGLSMQTKIANGYAMTRDFIRGWKVLEPKLANAHVIDDNIVKRWDAGCGYSGKVPLVIDLMKNTKFGGLEIVTSTFKHSGAPKKSSNISACIEFSDNKEFKNSRKIKVLMRHKPDMRELYKMGAWQVQRYTGVVPAVKSRYLKITGLPAQIAEMKIYSSRMVAAEIKRMKVFDINGDGNDELLVETLDRRITAFDKQGAKLFSIKVPFEIVNFIVADLDGDNKAEIVFPCFDLRLYKYDWQGKLLKVSKPLFQHPYTINVLNNTNTGKKKLAITYYYHHQFFDSDLNPLFRPKGFGAMWTENARPMDLDGDGIEDLVMSDIYARAYVVDGKSGAVSNLFWAIHGIFNAIFPVTTPVNGMRKVVFAGTGKLQCRKLKNTKVQEKNALWQFNDGSQFASTSVSAESVYTARFVGHSLLLSAETGKNTKLLWVKGRIFDMKIIADKQYFATDEGLKVYSKTGTLTARQTGCCKRIIPSNSGLWVEIEGIILKYKRQ